MFAARARAYGTQLRLLNLVGGKDELVFDGQSFASTRAAGRRLRRQFEEELLLCEISAAGPLASRWRTMPRSTRRCCSACATTCARTASGRWASGSPAASTPPWSPDRGRRARRGNVSASSCPRRIPAPRPRPMPGDCRQPRRRASSCRSRRDGVREALACRLRRTVCDARRCRATLRGPPISTRGGEHPGAHPRQPADGALQQVRLAGAHDRQQERDRGRLRTLYGDMAAGSRSSRTCRRRWSTTARDRNARRAQPGAASSSGRPPPSCGPTRRTATRCRPTSPRPILKAYVERDKAREKSSPPGCPASRRQGRELVDRNEYKRRQAAPGIRITPKAFGRDRRLPITNRFGKQASTAISMFIPREGA